MTDLNYVQSNDSTQVVTTHAQPITVTQSSATYNGRRIALSDKDTCLNYLFNIFSCNIYGCYQQSNLYNALSGNTEKFIKEAEKALKNGAELNSLSFWDIVQFARDQKKLSLDFLCKQIASFESGRFIRNENSSYNTTQLFDYRQQAEMIDPLAKNWFQAMDHLFAQAETLDAFCLLASIYVSNRPIQQWDQLSKVERSKFERYIASPVIRQVCIASGWHWMS